MQTTDLASPQIGQVVRVRQRRYLVEGVVPGSTPSDATLVEAACVDDDAQGQRIRVLWEHEVDAEILGGEAWGHLAAKGFDTRETFSAYLHTLAWNCVTSTDPRLLQAPFRAGIRIETYQLEPLVKALRLPRVNLFIADDVGLGKTIEAGLIARELLLRRKVDTIVIACPPSMIPQWQAELDARFGLTCAVLDREYFTQIRRQRGFGANPWTTHSRFLVSHRLLIDEDYTGPMRAWLGELKPGSLLILDEAHHAAPASGARYAIDSKFTHAIRDLAHRFEHRLFLSATPHNGHSNSFSSLMELLDPQRFLRGEPVEGKRMLEPVMVRRLKEDLRKIAGGFPERHIEQIDIDHLPGDSPELILASLLDEYRELRTVRLATLTKRQQSEAALVVTGLQHRLLSSIEAFAKTLRVHRRTIERLAKEPATAGGARPRVELFAQPPDADDDEGTGTEADAERDDEARTEAVTAATQGPVDPSSRAFHREQDLLERMTEIAEAARHQPDARVRSLVEWIRTHMCPGLPPIGVPRSPSAPAAKWNDLRLLIFTEWDDTRRYLAEQLRSAISSSDRAEERIGIYHGQSKREDRTAIQTAFNEHPARHPIRILVATDAAREGLNLQAHCWNLVHFDLPWNPSRLEQRNGRIDRKLQPKPDVYCRYFFYSQRPEDKVLQTIVRKTKTIRKQLGSLSAVVESKVEASLKLGIRRKDIEKQVESIDAADVDAEVQRTVAQELEDARERREELTTRIDELRTLLERSRKRIGLEEGHLRAALSCSLGLQGAKPIDLEQPESASGPARWRIPALDLRLGADPTWAETLDTLRAPRARDQQVSEWRRTAAIRPVTFDDPGTLSSDTVHLHLEHRLVQRLLGRFTAQGFVHHDLSRACLAQTKDAVPRVALLGRLCLYGPGATRLHEEILPVTARWIDPAQRKGKLEPYRREAEEKTLELIEQALLGQGDRPIDRVVQDRLLASAAQDIAELVDRLEERGREHADAALALLTKRGDAEGRSMRDILESQRKRILSSREKAPELTPTMFPDVEERRQRESERKAWARRLVALERELATEPDRIRALYGVVSRRLEPIGLVYLWPASG